MFGQFWINVSHGDFLQSEWQRSVDSDHLQTVVEENPSQSSQELDKPLNLSHTLIIMHPHDFDKKCLNLVREILIIYQFLSFLEDLIFVLHWRVYLLPNISWILSSSVMKAWFSVIIADENKKRLNTYKIKRIVPQTRTINCSKILFVKYDGCRLTSW